MSTYKPASSGGGKGAMGQMGGMVGAARGRGPFGGGGPMGMMRGEKPKDFYRSILLLLGYLRAHLGAIIIVFLSSVLSTGFAIVAPLHLGKATTLVFEGVRDGTGIDFTAIARICALLAVLYVMSTVFAWFQGIVMSGISRSVSYRLRSDLDGKIHRLPFSYFDTRTSGEILSHITNDVDTITQSLNQSLTQIVTSITTLAGVLAMMLVVSREMTLVALVIFPFSYILVRLIVERSRPHYTSQQAELGHVNGHIGEMYGCHVVVKVFGGEDASVAEFDRHNEQLYRSGWRTHFLSGLIQPVTVFFGNIGYVLVCMLGAALAVQGKLSVGNIQAFVQYTRQFNQPVMQIANISNTVLSMAAAAERVFAFLAVDEEGELEAVEVSGDREMRGDREVSGSREVIQLASVRGEVEFRNVRFAYTAEKTVIKDFSAKISSGAKVAIVGPTGAGKTTIVKLLMRFYDPSEGSILVDGRDSASLPRSEIRRVFGMVLQDTWLYNASVRENIRYGRLDATDKEVEEAARAAQAEHFIRLLPGGYDFVLNEEGSNVSRGQKQLLTIARAFLANPRILVLDEATSSVDTLTEIHIQKAMDALMHKRTSFVIAHRLSTIRDADLILVMDEGDIVEQGTHADLLARKGFYAELYESQFETDER